MPSPKTLSMNTDRFLTLWHGNLIQNGRKGDWKKFVATIMSDTQDTGIAHTHQAYFSSPAGKAVLNKYESQFLEHYNDTGKPLPANVEKAVMLYFYNEKCLDKCNAIRSKKEMKNARRPEGWKARPCVGKGGGAKAKDWSKVAKEWKGLFD